MANLFCYVPMKYDVIIIGAGASGLMCAIEAGKRGRKVLVLDHSKSIGNKIRISGGGHCNFTNINLNSENFLSQNPHFCKSALSCFTPQDFISMIKKHRIKYYEKEEGQLFCNGSSREIINMLIKECNDAGVDIRLNCLIKKIKRDDIPVSPFKVLSDNGMIESRSLVIATGGISYPELGATDIGYRVARQFGVRVTSLKPALVPFKLSPGDLKTFRELSGISMNTKVSCKGTEFRGDILFTHRGLSGPAILNISSYWENGDEIRINLLPDTDVYEMFRIRHQSKVEMENLLSGFLPKRFAHTWCEKYAGSKPMNQYSVKELGSIAQKLQNWIIKPAGTEGYRKAEITCGGVDTDELSSKTMEAKNIPGLYFIGEVVDVTGQLGGYNLHWAWASGYAAGQYV